MSNILPKSLHARKSHHLLCLCLLSDVDVPNPDEKSILTYVSSLYDVFPQVPSVEQSLKDNVRIDIRTSSLVIYMFDSKM